MATSTRTAPTTVLLVRHGLTPTTGTVLPGRAKGLHLSEAGKAQAEAVGAAVSQKWPKLAAIYVSPLERARETAAPLARKTGLKASVQRGLIECDFGAWTGRKIADLAKKSEWQTVQRSPSSFRFPDGESFLEMQARIVDTINDLAQVHAGQTIALFSHADPIKAALANALGMPMDMFQRITVATCSVSVVTYGPLGPQVVAVNTNQSGEFTHS